MTFRAIVPLLLALGVFVSVPRAQEGCLVWSNAEHRCLQATPITVVPPLASTAAMLGDSAGPPTPPNTFALTADAIFVCVARSIKALDTAVDREHHGYLTAQFASIKLRENASLRAAQAADVASCDKGSFVGAMERALQAEADESKRLQGLLQTSGVVPAEPAHSGLTAAEFAEANQTLFNLQQSRRTLTAEIQTARDAYAASCRTLHEQVNQACYGLRRAIDVQGVPALDANSRAIIAAARVVGVDSTEALR
jgi:hypothetical protein